MTNINQKLFKTEDKEKVIKLYHSLMTKDQIACIFASEQDFWLHLDYPNRKCFIIFVDDNGD